MNLYLISQTANEGWDTYDGAVVAAESEEAARSTRPSSYPLRPGEKDDTWTDPENVSVVLIGVAVEGTKSGVICASFNAG
jgi:hypothetical protein